MTTLATELSLVEDWMQSVPPLCFTLTRTSDPHFRLWVLLPCITAHLSQIRHLALSGQNWKPARLALYALVAEAKEAVLDIRSH